LIRELAAWPTNCMSSDDFQGSGPTAHHDIYPRLERKAGVGVCRRADGGRSGSSLWTLDDRRVTRAEGGGGVTAVYVYCVLYIECYLVRTEAHLARTTVH
jgi:hypothetical protein